MAAGREATATTASGTASIPTGFGPQLRQWRNHRRLSQLQLATAAEVSQRHLSFLEQGRSSPSPEMVLHLGRALELTRRDQNSLLLAAGYAPAFTEHGLDDPDLEHLRGVLQRLLDAHGPFPAYVVDRGWDLVMVNPMALWLVGLLEPAPPPEVAANVLRLALHPAGLRVITVDWEATARVLLERLERERTERPTDDRLQSLSAEVAGYRDLPVSSVGPVAPDGSDLIVPLTVRHGGELLRFYTMIATIGAAFDVTLEELRIEVLLPADPGTEQALRTIHARL